MTASFPQLCGAYRAGLSILCAAAGSAFAIGGPTPALPAAAEVQTIIVRNNLDLPENALLEARLVVRASHIMIDGHGATLRGPGAVGDPKSMENAGAGVRLKGCQDVTIRGVKARGFSVGLEALDCRALIIEACDFSDNYDNPKHGWGELPLRGGVLLEDTCQSVIRRNRANRVWNGLTLVRSDDNQVAENNFSHCSNVCGKLWRSSRNHFVQNNFSGGIRIDRAAGEVHARDSASVLIETGSDDNFFQGNDMSHGGDGLFIRVLNGWVSRGNIFVENDASYANNNCVESWSPDNTYIRNRANHGSYGFWLGGSDHTVLIGNEAAFNGQPGGNHNAPEPGFRHGGIVIVGGPSTHTIIAGNWTHDNNGGGIVFRGDVASRGARWRTAHWVVQQNRIENNRWGIWGRWGDWIWIANNFFRHNGDDEHLADVSNLFQPPADPTANRAPKAVLAGPAGAQVGAEVVFDARGSRDFQGRPLHFRWSDGEVSSGEPLFKRTFTRPGFYRVGLTVDNGTLADLAWRDLVVTEPVSNSPRAPADSRDPLRDIDASHELGTESAASLWGYELENNADGRGRIRFQQDADCVVGARSISFTPNPYPGFYATAIFPGARNADWDFSDKNEICFWIKAQNPNLPGFQNAGPVLWIYGRDGAVKLEPANGRNLLADYPFSEARWNWMRIEVPLRGNAAWRRQVSGRVDLKHVAAVGISLDSWGMDGFTVWLDGLTAK